MVLLVLFPISSLTAQVGLKLIPCRPSSVAPASVSAALNAGDALALIEVIAVVELDGRPVDANLVDLIRFNTLKCSGPMPSKIVVTKAFGGMYAGQSPIPHGPLYPTPLVVGQKYWLIFNYSDYKKYPQSVIAWWPEDAAPLELLEAAIKQDRYRHYVPDAVNPNR